MRFFAHVTAVGGEGSCPPRDSHLPHFPSYQRCQQAASLPTAKISSRPGAHEMAVGSERMDPPRLSHPFQELPSHHLCQRAESDPLAKTSSRLGAQAVTVIADMMTPPRVVQLDQALGVMPVADMRAVILAEGFASGMMV